MYLGTHTHTFVTITMKKRPFESEQGRFGGIWEDLEGRNGKKKLFNYAVNNKNEKVIQVLVPERENVSA